MIARIHRFFADKIAERCALISRLIGFDVANAMSLHREAAENAAQLRRQFIDRAIADFAGAIENVIKAIQGGGSFVDRDLLRDEADRRRNTSA